MILQESLVTTEVAYRLNDLSVGVELNEEEAREVLISHVIILLEGELGDYSNATRHKKIKQVRPRNNPTAWREETDLAKDALGNFKYSRLHEMNPFVSKRFSFATVSEIAQDVTHSYGTFND